MGGFQALEFAVARPDFAARIVSIEGTPRPALPDILLWETELRAVESLKDLKKGDKTAMKIISPVHTAALWTPPYLSGPSVPASAETFIGRADEGINKYDAWNWARQLEAIRNQDIYRFFDGNMKLAAGTVKARVLMILSPHDHMVNPLPSHEFARLAAAEVVELQGECGHMAFVCESAKVAEAAANFLEKQ
jgi:homoserine O-acetyltransferase